VGFFSIPAQAVGFGTAKSATKNPTVAANKTGEGDRVRLVFVRAERDHMGFPDLKFYQ